MSEVDLKWLEPILKEKYDTSAIISVNVKPGVSDGENYVSNVYRVSVLTLSKDGKEKNLSIILKRKLNQPLDHNPNLKTVLDLAFNKEYNVYTDVLGQIEKYLNNESLWAYTIGHIPNEDIYFEDLVESGYVLADRLKGLDYEHCNLVFQNLAKFHAASLLALDKNEINVEPYSKYIMVENAPEALKIKSNAYALMVDVIRKEWSSEWASVADRLEEICSTLPERVLEVGKLDKSRINVICHGDVWVNNMMFKYDASGKPISLKFIDFQMTHYNSYGFDLSYFLSTSIDPVLKKKHLDSLIETYCQTFSSHLDHFRSNLSRPTPESVQHEIKRLATFSLNTTLRLRPVTMVAPGDAVPIGELFKDTGLNSRKRKLYTSLRYKKAVEEDIPFLINLITKEK